ncbi:C40 family peptidase [Rhizobium sp. C4]|uniref:C40 family peptidase n=1 Tax=Rhizobium sp. C4 TaxID=1349800 RepID=UPI001E3E28A8|nr:NlpC/P60 family protein [Rhizobium sp. C4]MCD2172654.1 NlpC/P60 family protein [Rhizobium sp. C4]
MPVTLDKRLNAYRPDLADARLEGKVEASRFVKGEAGMVTAPVADLRPRPDLSAGIDTQLLFGEPLRIFERHGGWAWVQAEVDGYVGYMAEADLVSPAQQTTFWIIQPRTFLYPEPDMKRPRGAPLSLGSRIFPVVQVETRGTRYLTLAGGGSVIAAHCAPLGAPVSDDYVAIAARLLETPYLWGGKSAFGIDCSGLVQLSMMMAGKSAPRDSDMQAAGLGTEIGFDELRRGDLVFWKGHVAIMEDEETMIHANGHTMSVAREGLKAAVERIGYLYGKPTVCRRP